MLIAQHQHKGRPDLGILLIDGLDIERLASHLSAVLHPENRGMVWASRHVDGFMPITTFDQRSLYLQVSGEYFHFIDELTLLLLFRDQLIQIIERGAEKAGFRIVDDDVRIEPKLLLTLL